ncbi:hypothetical protein NX059_005595 [Plenodomus lindquistii]|nr:hypothetical protein NX059_005595 [Plenodomus lindquistii]
MERWRDDTGVNEATYRAHIDEWANEALYPRSTAMQQMNVTHHIRSYINEVDQSEPSWRIWSPYQDIQDPPLPLTLSWQHLYSTIVKEINPDVEVYQSTDREVRNHDYAFTDFYKARVLNDFEEWFLQP